MALEIATFGGGCFWCTEAVFQQIRGIKSVEPGYSGGQVDDPSYDQICEGNTGHAEVVRLIFDNAAVSYKALVEIFFAIHDPTTLNRQGSDVGTQYRSVIFCQSEEQKACAAAVMADVEAKWEKPIVTAIEMAPMFYPAEDYHHNYFKMNSQQRYCTLVVAPKVAKARQFFSGSLSSR
ncbi:peptide-methionine (S)-S-oxide reductase MsrA [Undibacterium sp. RuTC16W]|uniref:peptide-methionine (S)-S-oxide reductase MsrA n=1 Tax=Undibacterium sp. RuTC16W TaxID=3413048 RepID=UPI003BF274AF